MFIVAIVRTAAASDDDEATRESGEQGMDMTRVKDRQPGL